MIVQPRRRAAFFAAQLAEMTFTLGCSSAVVTERRQGESRSATLNGVSTARCRKRRKLHQETLNESLSPPTLRTKLRDFKPSHYL